MIMLAAFLGGVIGLVFFFRIVYAAERAIDEHRFEDLPDPIGMFFSLTFGMTCLIVFIAMALPAALSAIPNEPHLWALPGG